MSDFLTVTLKVAGGVIGLGAGILLGSIAASQLDTTLDEFKDFF